MEELAYTRAADEEPEQNVFYGKYASLRRDYLKKHRPTLWAAWVNSGKLADHLKEIEQAAEQRMEMILPHLMKAAGVTEELKARDQMAWVGLVNNCKAQAEEIIYTELIYC